MITTGSTIQDSAILYQTASPTAEVTTGTTTVTYRLNNGTTGSVTATYADGAWEYTIPDSGTFDSAGVVHVKITNASAIPASKSYVVQAANTFKATGFSTHSAADVWSAGTRTLTANTNLNDPTASAIADAVWDEATSGHTATGSFGKLVSDISGLIIAVPTAVWSAGTRTLTGFGTLASDIWSAATRTLTANTNLNIPTVGQIADQVWDETMADHTTAGSTGATLDNIDTAVAAINVGTGSGATLRKNTGNPVTVGGQNQAGAVMQFFTTVARTGTPAAQDTTGADGIMNTGVMLDPGTYYQRIFLNGHALRDDVAVATGTTEALSYNP